MNRFIQHMPPDQREAVAREGVEWKAAIVSGLRQAYEENFTRSFAFWVRQMDAYLDMKHTFELSEKSEIVRALIDMSFRHPQHTTKIRRWMKTIVRLCKPYEILPNLTVQWRPFFDLIEESGFGRMRGGLPIKPSNFPSSIVGAVSALRRYFPPNAGDEIFEFLRPRLTPPDEIIYRTVCELSVFLPTEAPSVTQGVNWLPNVIELLSINDSSVQWDNYLFSVLARLAEHQYQYVDWSPYVDFLSTRILRAFDVPIGTQPVSARRSVKFPSNCNFFATEDPMASLLSEISALLVTWITPLPAHVVSSRGSEVTAAELNEIEFSGGMSVIEKLFNSLESFFHPSNGGAWSARLAQFLQGVAYEYCSRVRRERFETRVPITIPKDKHLSAVDDEALVTLMLPIVRMAIYGKSGPMMWAAVEAFKHLAALCPRMVFPPLIEMASFALQTLTETHQTVALLRALSVCTSSMLRRSSGYPEALVLIPELFQMALPGIDPNDLGKTRATLAFFSSLFGSVPLHRPGDKHADEEYGDAAGFLVMMEGWTVQFVTKLVHALASFKEGGKGEMWMAVRPIERALLKVFQNLHVSFVQPVCDLLIENVFSDINLDAVKPLSVVISQLCRAHPRVAFAAFLPRLIDRLTTDTLTENEVKWYGAVLRHSIRRGGQDLLPYRAKLETLMDALVSKRSVHTERLFVKQGAKVVRAVLEALTLYYPTDFRSLNPSDMEESISLFDPSHFWSKTYKLDQVETSWHVPSASELDWALMLIQKYGDQVLKRLQAMMPLTQNVETLDERSVEMDLLLLRCVVAGASTLIPKEYTLAMSEAEVEYGSDEEDPSSPLFADDERAIEFRAKITCFGELYGTYRSRLQPFANDIVSTFRSVVKFLKNPKFADRVGVFTGLCKLIRAAVGFHGISRKKVEFMERLLDDIKSYLFDTLAPQTKSYSRSFWMDRIDTYYQQRLNLVVDQRRPSAVFRVLMYDLMQLGLHQYSKVRKAAQTSLTAIVYMFPVYTVQGLLHIPIDILAKKDAADHEVTGACYILSTFIGDIMCSWKLVLRTGLALMRHAAVGTASVEARVNQFHGSFATSSYDLPLTSKSVMAGVRKQQSELLRMLQSEKSTMSWKSVNLGLMLLGMCSREDNLPGPEVVAVLLEQLVSDVAHVRSTAMTTMSKVLALHKPHQPKREFQSDGAALDAAILDARKFPETDEEHSSFVFFEKLAYGFRCQAQSKMVYDYSRIAVPKDPQLAAAVKSEIIKAFDNSQWRTAFVKKTSTDLQQQFSSLLADFSKGLIQVCGLELLFDHFLGAEIQRCLATQAEYEEQQRKIQQAMKAHQPLSGAALVAHHRRASSVSDGMSSPTERRGSGAGLSPELRASIFGPGVRVLEKSDLKESATFACSLMSGVHRGLKHLSLSSKLKGMEFVRRNLLPHLYTCDPECVSAFTACIRHIVYDCDPLRCRWLVNALLSELTAPNALDGAPALQQRRLKYLAPVLGEIGWRSFLLNSQVIRVASANFDHPYAQIRDALAALTSTSIHNLVQRPLSQDRALFDSFFSKVEYRVTDSDARKKYIVSVMWHLGYITKYLPHVAARFVLTAASLHVERDEELLRNCRQALMGASVSLFCQPALALEQIKRALTGAGAEQGSWKMRSAILTFLQRFAFHHGFLLFNEASAMRELLDMLCGLLMDNHVEVREMAATTLSGLFRMSGDDVPQDLAASRFRKWSNVKFTRLRGFSSLSSASSSTSSIDMTNGGGLASLSIEDKEKAQEKLNLIQRHAGVLGLCAVVLSHPYGVPAWMVPIIRDLTSHVDDPAPISTSVKRCFTDFWRTQKDTWHEFKGMFDADDLNALTELVISPNYYA